MIAGEVGDYVRSHGGHVELVAARDGEVEVGFGGACVGCPARDVTLTQRFEQALRDRYPSLRGIRATSEAPAPGRRRLPLLPLLPTRPPSSSSSPD